MIRWQGYAPDMDPTTQGIFTNCAATVPTLKGFAGAPSPQTTTLPALAAACQGAAVLKKLDGSNRFFAGTGTKLYEAAASSWTDRTRASGGDYGPASDLRWSFAQYGDVSLAVNKADTLQASTTGAFADVSGAPSATVVEVVGQFVFCCDTNDATYGDSPDRVRWSALGDHTDWTASVATQAGSVRLLGSPGQIRAAKRFGNGIIVYKDQAMYLGAYSGPPAIWEFVQVPGEIGAMSQYAVINVGTPEDPKHVFMGVDDFYLFDGARPVPIGSPWVKETVFGELDRTYQYLSAALHDRINSRIYFYYPASANVRLEKAVVYNYKTGKWGRDDRQIQVPVDYVVADTTYEDLGDLYATYSAFPEVSYGTAFWSANFPVPAIFNTSNVVQTLTGASVTSSVTTGDIGDDDLFSLMHRVQIRYLTSPTSADMVNYYRNNLGDSLTLDATTAQSSGRFDVLRSARWHRQRFDFVGDWEATGMRVGLSPEGNE